MRFVKTLIVGVLLATASPSLYAQDATGAAQAVRKSAEAAAAAQASGQTAKPADKPAAQSTAKKTAPAPTTQSKTAPASAAQSKTAASAPGKPSTPAQSKTAASAPGKPATPAQAKPATAAQSATQPGKPAAEPAAKPNAQAGKPAAKSAKPAGQTKAKAGGAAAAKPRAKSTAKKGGRKPVTTTAENLGPTETKVGRRDPFASLLGREGGGGGPTGPLPPGKAGLQVSTLRLDGVVSAPNGMIAVVSNPQARTYFLREGDQLYDGRVEKIAMDGVSFHEMGKDAFGKPVERQVNKRIYASAGEQQ